MIDMYGQEVFAGDTIVTWVKEGQGIEYRYEDYVSTLLNRANILHLEQEIIYLKAENEKIHELLKEIVPTDEIKKRTFNILTEVLCNNCERIFSLYEELCVKQESK